jgi:hypothetical protein
VIPTVVAMTLVAPTLVPSAPASAASPALTAQAAPQVARHIVYMRPQGAEQTLQSLLTARPFKAQGQGDLLWGNGPVQHTPTTYAIFWGPSWLTSATKTSAQKLKSAGQVVANYFADIGGSAFERILTQYFDGSGHVANSQTLAHTVVDTTAPPSDASCGGPTIEDSSVQNEILHAAATLGWPIDANNATYFVYTPSTYYVNDGTGICSEKVFCAYHAWSTVTPHMAYVLLADPFDAGCRVPRSPHHNIAGDSLANMTSHEQFEAITDPQAGNGWLDASGLEIGDKCFWDFSRGYTHLRHTGTFELQTEYSNATHACLNVLALPRHSHPTR